MRSFSIAFLVFAGAVFAQQPSVEEIIAKSVAANQSDFQQAPDFNFKERDHTPGGSKTYQVTMIEGSPYYRVIALNGEPLSAAQNAVEEKKQQKEIENRRSESPDQRQKRIDKYEKDRRRDNSMMSQLTQGFNFTVVGEQTVRKFKVWVLKATPKPGYQPPNMECQVLKGMQGELWVDQQTYQWVKVTARVIHPVSIEGFLAQVEPGTQFELENSPVEGGSWQATHFAMKSNAKVLYMFHRASQDDETYFDYQRIGSAANSASNNKAFD